MTLTINGERLELAEGTTVAQFLRDRDLTSKRVVVEIDGEILARESFEQRRFREGNVVEIVHFVGGG